MGHALLSPSKAARWLNCPPSARLEEQFPDSTSEYAAEGTLAHALSETVLRFDFGEIDAATYQAEIDKIESDPLYYTDMFDHCLEYIEYVNELSRGYTEFRYVAIEQKLDLSQYVPQCSGTADAIVITDNVLHVCDLKYGKGVKVDAFENPQLKLYALGAYDQMSLLYDIDKVTLNIIQPRLNHISTFELTVEELLLWANDVKEIAKMAFDGKGSTQAGPWCKFCKCNPQCKKLADQQLEIAKYEFKQADFLTDKELVDIFQRSKEFKVWLDSVNDYIKDSLDRGVKIKGLKLVKSQSRRSWTDADKDMKAIEQAAVDAGFKKDIVYKEPELVSFSALEKAVGKKKFEAVFSQFISSKDYKAVALEDDKREALSSSVEDDFS